MEQALRSLDIENVIGQVTLSNGTKLDVPKLSLQKLIRIVKFLGVDGVRIYDQMREVLLDDKQSDLEKIALVLEQLKEEQLVRILSILLDVDDQTALQLDLNEMLEVLLVYAEKTNLSQTFTQVQKLMKKMTGKNIPDLQTLLGFLFPPVEENETTQAGPKSQSNG
ncbi:hypothetical protein H1164_13995 [Thermoactinomyces daqus]|uniref:Uncharacterized protein n=1 Tax=Thermoactinomyces daqus TaxID=1329516 RepID=A0A7W1XC76_9BACL|nr:hypothetical protein [Thermoactinomyces daqus]MBA4543996.1 hypothetical protein [Thermoactinomyces daqus]